MARKAQRECALQRQCFKELATERPDLVPFMQTMIDGAMLVGGGKQMNLFKQRGYKPGFPDTFIFKPVRKNGHIVAGGCAIEFKMGKRQLSSTQVEWRARLAPEYKHAVVRTMAEFFKVITDAYPDDEPEITQPWRD